MISGTGTPTAQSSIERITKSPSEGGYATRQPESNLYSLQPSKNYCHPATVQTNYWSATAPTDTPISSCFRRVLIVLSPLGGITGGNLCLLRDGDPVVRLWRADLYPVFQPGGCAASGDEIEPPAPPSRESQFPNEQPTASDCPETARKLTPR